MEQRNAFDLRVLYSTRWRHTACLDPEHALSHHEEMRATRLIIWRRRRMSIWNANFDRFGHPPPDRVLGGRGGDLPNWRISICQHESLTSTNLNSNSIWKFCQKIVSRWFDLSFTRGPSSLRLLCNQKFQLIFWNLTIVCLFEAEGFGLPCMAWAGSRLLVKSRLIRIRADEELARTRKYQNIRDRACVCFGRAWHSHKTRRMPRHNLLRHAPASTVGPCRPWFLSDHVS